MPPLPKGPPPPPASPPRAAPAGAPGAAPPPVPARAQAAAAASPEPTPVANPGPHAKVVMVVEDDAAIRDMLVRSLGSSYCVYESSDGQIALETLARMKPPDLIIMDVMMPRMDGWTLASKVKAESRLKNVPLIFLTGRDSPKDVVQGINAGARHYLTKPFKIQTLLEKVGKAIGEKK
jgi:CheY-like chemotaxis protein